MVFLSLILLTCLVPFWYSFGQGCSTFVKLPSITGYIVCGIFCGPHVSAVLRQHHLTDIAFIEHACLSYIALLAGAELHLGGIKRIRRQVTWMVAGISFFSWVSVFSCAVLASSRTPFLAALPQNQILSVCNLLGVLSLARSPASAISVIHETKGSGPYCSLVMAIVIVKDVLVFLAFSLALNAAEQASIRATTSYSLVTILYPFSSVASSVALGTLGGIVFQKMHSGFAMSSSWPLSSLNSIITTHSSKVLTFLRCSFPLIISSSVYYISDRLHAEPLLACVAAGATGTYIAASSSSSSAPLSHQADQLKLHASPSPSYRLERQRSVSLGVNSAGAGEEATSASSQQQMVMTVLLVPISTILFGLVGANLHLDKLLGNIHLAALLFVVRLVGVWIGSWLGGYFGAVPATLRERVPYGMVTQAGIAMGLTRIAVARCKICAWGPDFEAAMAAIIVGNLILGPLLFKSAIVASGEAAGVPASSLTTGTLAGPTSTPVPMMTPVKSHQMEEGYVTPVKADRPGHHQQYDGHFHSNHGNGADSTTNTTPSFVPIIHLNSITSPFAKSGL